MNERRVASFVNTLRDLPHSSGLACVFRRPMLAFTSAFLAFASVIEVNQATCPCLTESPVSAEYQDNGNLKRPANGELYPLAYGVGCKKHNEMKGADCTVASPPGWCSSMWCWVSANNCNDPAIPGVIASGGSSYFPDPDGAPVSVYSYATCGQDDTFTDSDQDVNQ